MDIYDKLKTLSREQAKQLGASLNSCYPDKKHLLRYKGSALYPKEEQGIKPFGGGWQDRPGPVPNQ